MARVMLMNETTRQLEATSSVDLVKDTWIDWGTGAGQVAGGDVPLADSGGFFAVDDVESALAEIAGYNFNTRKYFPNGNPNVVAAATRALISNVNQVPTEVMADQSTTNVGVMMGASHYNLAPGPLPVPASGAAATVEDRRILMIIVDVNGDPVLMAGGQQVYALYESLRNVGSTLYAAGGDAQWAFVYNDAGTYKYAAFPGATGTYYSWPVIRYDFIDLPEDAMLYGGGGAEDIDNTPYTAGTGIAISPAYAISFDQAAALATLTGTWTAGAAFTLNAAAAGFSDGMTVPVNAGAPGATVGPEGTMMWDSTGDNLYVSQGGGTWKQISSAASLPASTAAGDLLIGDGSLGWAVETPTRINSSGDITNTATAGADDFTIALTGAFDASMILSSTGTGVDALQVRTSVGGMVLAATTVLDIDAGTALQINSAGGAISLGNDAVAQAVNIATGAAARVITIGNAASASMALDAGVGGFTALADTTMDLDSGGALSLNSTGGSINIGNDANAQAVNIATGAAARVITIGNAASASMAIEGGVGSLTMQTDTTMDLDSGGALSLNSSAGLINIGNDAVAQAINIGTGGAARTITVGNTTGATALVFNTGTGGTTFNIPDADAAAFLIQQGADGYLNINTTNGTEIMTFGSAVINPDYSFLGSGTFAQGAGGGQVTFTGNVDATAGLDVTGADLNVGANFAVGVDGIVDNGTWQADVITTTYGGTGQNWSAVVAGSLPYFNGVGTMTTLGIGSAYQMLRTNAGATAPEWTSEGAMVTGSIVAVAAGVATKRLVAAHNDAGTGKLEEASAAAASTAFQVVGVALAPAAGGAAVRLQTTGVVTLTLPAVHAAITAGDTAYLAQAAGGYVVMYTNIALTSTAYIVAVGIFLQTIAANTGGDVLVALGGVGAQATYIP